MLGLGTTLGRPLLPSNPQSAWSRTFTSAQLRRWQSRFGGRSDIVGTKIMIRWGSDGSGGRCLALPSWPDQAPKDFWAPLSMLINCRMDRILWIGASRESGNSRTTPSRRGHIGTEAGASNSGFSGLRLNRRGTGEIGILSRLQATSIPLTSELLVVFSPLVAAFVLVLVLACTNVASMSWPGHRRQRELASGHVRGCSRATDPATISKDSPGVYPQRHLV